MTGAAFGIDGLVEDIGFSGADLSFMAGFATSLFVRALQFESRLGVVIEQLGVPIGGGMAPLARHDDAAVLFQFLLELSLVFVRMAFEAMLPPLREIGNHEPVAGTGFEGERTRMASLAFDFYMPSRERISGEAMVEFDLLPGRAGVAG